MKERYAIVVVGAGPAGCNFARRVDYKKYDVLLLDGTEQRGEKVCAGLLSPDAQDLLAEYDICIPNEILHQSIPFPIYIGHAIINMINLFDKFTQNQLLVTPLAHVYLLMIWIH